MEFLKRLNPTRTPIPILSIGDEVGGYAPIDLSVNNDELKDYDITDAAQCQQYIEKILKKEKAKVVYGGYLEQRNLYGTSGRFKGESPRNIHLGIDFWSVAGTQVLAPLDGKVHSYANNSDYGNYGPTIILEHKVLDNQFYTLYGHLSLESLEGLKEGERIQQGDSFASLGTTEVNVGYAPHLHFQLICDLGNYHGDYPGVCSSNEVSFYAKNCPNPNLLLGYDR